MLHVSRASFDLYLLIDGNRYRCSDAAANFALNKIPSARVSVAVGRDAHTLKRAMIHDTVDKLKILKRAQIILCPKGQWNHCDPLDGPRWTAAGEQVIFDGYLTGVGYRKSRGTMQFSVSLIHWLADLGFSSALSNQSHPGNPSRFRWLAAWGQLGNTVTKRNSFISTFTADALFIPESIATDFWERSIHQFFCALSAEDILDVVGPEYCHGMGGSNEEAQAALARIETHLAAAEAPGTTCEDGAGSPYWKPLPMVRGSVFNNIAKSISADMRNRTIDSFFSSTLWDKLVGDIGPRYKFSLVPKVQTAQIVPFVPGLRTTFDQEFGNGVVLDVRDISYIDSSSFIPRPLRAVGIIQGASPSSTGALGADVLTELGGCFAPDINMKGTVIYLQPPSWLANAPYHAHSPSKTLLAPVPSSSTTPQAPGGAVGDETGETPNSTINQMGDYYDRAARYEFVQEMLRGRYAVIQGKLRFDIAPGTNISILNRDPPFLDLDGLSGDMVGSVVRVGIALNAESGVAGTSFQLDNVRTMNENTDDRTSIAAHPLYSTIFSGAPLLHEYVFPE